MWLDRLDRLDRLDKLDKLDRLSSQQRLIYRRRSYDRVNLTSQQCLLQGTFRK